MDRDRELEQLGGKLEAATNLLKESIGLIKTLNLDVPANVKRVAEALANIIELQFQLYHLRPDLAPEYMRDKFPLTDANRPGEAE